MMINIKYFSYYAYIWFFGIIEFSLKKGYFVILSIHYTFVMINYININIFYNEIPSLFIFLTNFNFCNNIVIWLYVYKVNFFKVICFFLISKNTALNH